MTRGSPIDNVIGPFKVFLGQVATTVASVARQEEWVVHTLLPVTRPNLRHLFSPGKDLLGRAVIFYLTDLHKRGGNLGQRALRAD
jgi:hypothetical protein